MFSYHPVVSASLSVVHVVATDGHRGAEVFAADLVGALASCADLEQTVAVLRACGRRGPRYSEGVHDLGTDGGISVLGVGARQVVRLRRLLRSHRGAVVQAHGGEALKHVLAAVVGLAGIKVVYRRIGMAPTAIVVGSRRAAHAALMRRASHVVAVSDAVRDETIRAFRLHPDRIVTIPNAVDPERLRADCARAAARSALGIPADAVVVLSLGALSWEKDPLGAVAVTAPLLASRTRAVHLFVGEGPLRAELERFVRREEIGSRVMVVGSHNDVGNVLVASDLVLLASRADGMEGMPSTVIEAGFAGLPVAAYGVAGVAEVVVDGQTGLVRRAGDRNALSKAVAEMAGDPSLRRRMGEAAAERCRDRFSIATVAPRYLRLYERLVSDPPRSRGPMATGPQSPAGAS